MPVNYNKLDQSLDIKGSVTPDNAKTLVDESTSIGVETQTGTGDSIGGASPDMTLTDAGATFSAADVGRWITISGAPTGANDGTFLVNAYTSPTVIGYSNAAGSAEAAPTATWAINEGYSLEDDLNFVRTDRKLIKGTAQHYSDVPVYERISAIGTDVPANLTNIASKTLDAKGLVTNRHFGGQAVAETNTLVTLTSAGNMQWADAVDRRGIPINDGADVGNDLATYAEVIDPATGLGLEVTGKAVGDITCVPGANINDGETFVLDDGTNPAVTFEFDNNGSVVPSNILRPVDYPADNTGTGDTIGGVAPTMTLTDAGATFAATDVGREITISGSPTPANDGTFPIVGYTSPTVISYTNASGVAEAAPAATWIINDTAAQMMVRCVIAVNDAPVLDMDATAGAGALFDLINKTPGVAGNVAIVDTVADAGFTHNGMAGGTAYAGNRIYARMQGGAATEPNSVEAAFRSVAPGSPLSASVAYTWEKIQPISIDVYYPYREQMDEMSETALRTTLTNGIVADAGVTQQFNDIRQTLGIAQGITDFGSYLTNTGNYYVFSVLDSNPSAVEIFNAINDQIGPRDYTGAVLTDGETITESLQALADAIAGANFVRTIERLAGNIPGGTAHTIPGAQTYTLDPTNNGQYMSVYWRGLLRDPGPAAGGNDYAETSVTQITPYKVIAINDHINYYIYA